MGRQVNFFATAHDEARLIEFIKKTGDIVVFPYSSVSPIFSPLDQLPGKGSTKFWAHVWLVNNDFSPTIVTEFIPPQGYHLIDESRSDVIEFSRSIQDGDALRPGRIWAEFDFLDDSGSQLVPKRRDFKRWFGVLAKWIRMNYSKEINPDFYVAPDAMMLVRAGKLQLRYY
jgi:hypothetical protein